MKPSVTKMRFVELRAAGWSYNKISKEINVSTRSLVIWGRLYRIPIEDLKEQNYEEILEKYRLTKEERLKRIGNELERIWEQYDLQEYNDLSKKDLLKMMIQFHKMLHAETTDKKVPISAKLKEDHDIKQISEWGSDDLLRNENRGF